MLVTHINLLQSVNEDITRLWEPPVPVSTLRYVSVLRGRQACERLNLVHGRNKKPAHFNPSLGKPFQLLCLLPPPPLLSPRGIKERLEGGDVPRLVWSSGRLHRRHRRHRSDHEQRWRACGCWGLIGCPATWGEPHLEACYPARSSHGCLCVFSVTGGEGEAPSAVKIMAGAKFARTMATEDLMNGPNRGTKEKRLKNMFLQLIILIRLLMRTILHNSHFKKYTEFTFHPKYKATFTSALLDNNNRAGWTNGLINH